MLSVLAIGLTSTLGLSGCSMANHASALDNNLSTNVTTISNGFNGNTDASTNSAVTASSATSAGNVMSTVLHSFDEANNWLRPDASAYSPGLSTVKAPQIPSAFEQSVRPQAGVASILVSRGIGNLGAGKLSGTAWTQEIQYNNYAFAINGQTYVVPAKYDKQQILVLPLDHGIVWAPVSEPPSDMNHVAQALQGATDIYYSPYQTNGGSLANGERRIAQVPHRWMGLDGPVVASAWSGWLPNNQVTMAHVQSATAYHLQFDQKSQLKSVAPVKGAVPGWPTLFMRDLSKLSYYQKPHYAAFVRSLTRTQGGFTLSVSFMDATQSGRNAGMNSATYYWSEQTGKWTPLVQSFTVQTLGGWAQTGSNGVYWIQPSPIGNGSGNELDVTEMHFDPTSLTIQSVWLGNWFYGPSVVDGDSWEVVLPNDMPTSVSGQAKKWTVFTPGASGTGPGLQ